MQLQINCTFAGGTFTGLIVWQIMYQKLYIIEYLPVDVINPLVVNIDKP